MYFKAEDGKQIQCEDGKFDGLKPEQLVWKEGMKGWERADKVFPDAFVKADPAPNAPKLENVQVPNPVMVVASFTKPEQAPVTTELRPEDKARVQQEANVLLSQMDSALPSNDVFEGEQWRGYQACVDAWISKLQRKYPQLTITVIFIPDEKPRFKASIK